jgi:EAL domain-containing protein (putative c-di-GMP-specific phosphodiesterase class I)
MEYIRTSEFIKLAKEYGYIEEASDWRDGRKVASLWHNKFKLGKHTATGRLLFSKAKAIKFLEGKK